MEERGGAASRRARVHSAHDSPLRAPPTLSHPTRVASVCRARRPFEPDVVAHPTVAGLLRDRARLHACCSTLHVSTMHAHAAASAERGRATGVARDAPRYVPRVVPGARTSECVTVLLRGAQVAPPLAHTGNREP